MRKQKNPFAPSLFKCAHFYHNIEVSAPPLQLLPHTDLCLCLHCFPLELQVSGDAGEVDAFLEAITQSELRAHIRETNVVPLSEPPAVRGFEIRHG